MKKALIVIAVAVVVGLLFLVIGISYSNTEVRLRNKATALQKDCQVVHDKMWKVLAQKTEVTEKHAAVFSEWLKTIVEGREGGSLLKFTTENYPQEAGTQLFKDLSAATESLRAEYAQKQRQLIDVKREHDNIRTTFPASMVCGSRPELDIKIITSTRTEKAYETGKDDDVELFKKGK